MLAARWSAASAGRATGQCRFILTRRRFVADRQVGLLAQGARLRVIRVNLKQTGEFSNFAGPISRTLPRAGQPAIGGRIAGVHA